MAVLVVPVVLVASAENPRAVLSLPVVLLKSALTPLAVLSMPVVLLTSAEDPLAVLSLPVVFLKSALTPLAVLSLPVVLVASAEDPLAVLSMPMVLLKSAEDPLAVLVVPVVLLKSVKNPRAVLSLPVVLLASAPVPRLVLVCAAATPARESETITLIVGRSALLPGNVPRLISVMLFELTGHVPVPLQAGVPPPLQPVNVDPGAGVAVRVTAPLKDAEQVSPQLMPPGELVTVPVPTFVTLIVGPSPSELEDSIDPSALIAA